jgi:uncharacterized protein with NRDE domain
MCTLALFFEVFGTYPLLIAANRDERYDRPAAPPALIAGSPKIIAGRDLRAGGTWLGVNEYGLMVGILNRRVNGAVPAHANPRSRGLLCLDLLTLRNTAAAFDFLRQHEDQYNPFTLVFIDPGGGGVAFNTGGAIALRALGVGIHVFSSAAIVDTQSGKADRAYGRFFDWAKAAPTPQPPTAWLAGIGKLLGDHTTFVDDDPRDAICVHGVESGTVSSSIVLYSAPEKRFESHYCAGAPCQNSFAAPLILDVR